MSTVPGLTETFGDPCASMQPWLPMTALKGICDRKIILLSTATITEENLYSNGLFQNVFIFYRMFDAMGYAPILLISEKPKSVQGIPGIMRTCRMMVTEDMLKQPMANVVAVLELGMSLDPLVRQFIKMIGGRLLKVYLGNILNIDIEIPIFMPSNHFAHHVVGRNDMILVSPHYGQHVEYASYINHVLPPKDVSKMIAPYVWDHNVLTRNGSRILQWRPPATPEEEVFVIMEPNISFQKSGLVPLFIVEKWYREVGKPKGWKGSIQVVNGERYSMIPHFIHNIMPHLDIFRDARVELLGRRDIVTALTTWPSATFLLHNVNNEFNYMTLELLSSGFPVLHNSPSWLAYGYGYQEADLATGATLVESIRKGHAERLETYRAHAATLAWRYSPYNPEIHAAWAKIIENVT
jgi:hypothetical protein